MGLTQVSTDGVKNDAITKTKIPANQIEASELADNAVDTNAIANNAVTAGKLASGVQTTINNNADNRVITGSGSANTLNGESDVIIDSSGRVLIGHSTARTGVAGMGDPLIQHEGLNSDDSAVSLIRNTNSAFGGSLILGKTRGTSVGANTLVQNGDDIFTIRFAAGDGTDINSECATIKAEIDGVASANDVPGRLAFATTADGASSPTERMRIASNGNVGIGCTNPGSRLEIRNDTATHGVLAINRANNDAPALMLGNNSSNNALIASNDTDLLFGRDSAGTFTERMRMLNGGGLTFNGDTAAANALDDYEEGRYAPTPTGQNGSVNVYFYNTESYLSYTKIGNLVTIHGRLRLEGSNYSGGLRISLPFAADTSSQTDNSGGSFVGTHSVNFDNDAVGTGHNMSLFLETGHGSSLAYFLINRDNASWIVASAGNIKSGSYMLINHTYKST